MPKSKTINLALQAKISWGNSKILTLIEHIFITSHANFKIYTYQSEVQRNLTKNNFIQKLVDLK